MYTVVKQPHLSCLSSGNQTHIKHTKCCPTSWTRRCTSQPPFRLVLVLSTGKPFAHTVYTPHRAAVAGDAFSLARQSTKLLQFDVGRMLHATNARFWILISLKERDDVVIFRHIKHVKSDYCRAHSSSKGLSFSPVDETGIHVGFSFFH